MKKKVFESFSAVEEKGSKRESNEVFINDEPRDIELLIKKWIFQLQKK